MTLEQARRQLTVRASLILFTLLFLSTTLQPLLWDHPPLLSYMGIFHCVLAGGCYLYLYNAEPRSWHPYILIVTGLVILLPVLWISGGVNSPFAVTMPVVPLLIFVLVRNKIAWLFSFALIGLLVSMHLLTDWLPELPGLGRNQPASSARMVWLVLASILGAAFGNEAGRILEKLGARLNDEIRQDALTKLSNRTNLLDYLTLKLDEVQATGRWLTLFRIDIDNFKQVNELYGTAAGDACLRQTAETIQSSIRAREDQVARYAGDEFVIVLEDVDQSNAIKIANKILRQIARLQVQGEFETFGCSVSIGYCSLPGEQIQSAQQLLMSADTALRTAKQSGKNQVVGAESALVTQNGLGGNFRQRSFFKTSHNLEHSE